MRTPRYPQAIGLLVAVFATAVAAIIRFALDPLLGEGAPFTLFLLATAAAAWFGGFLPGLLATLLGGAIGDFLFTEPIATFDYTPDHVMGFASYLLLGVSISLLSELWHRSSDREQARARELVAMVESLRRNEESLQRARRSAEERMQESAAQFRTIADLAPAKLWISDAAGRYTYLSPKWYAFSGRGPEQDLGHGWKDVLHPEDLARLDSVVGEAMERRADFSVDARFRRDDGEYRWMASAGAARFDEGGAFLGYVGVVVDVHERKVFEQELRDADRRKDEFLATLAHELRNPLAPIRNGLQVMRLAQDAATVERAREMIDRQLAQMVRLIDDLLDVSRISSGKIELRKAWINLQDVMQSAIETSRPLIDTLKQDLQVTLPSEPIPLEGDSTRLAQAFSNLLQNAAKYSEAGGRISVTAWTEGGRVLVSVRDAGMGISPDLLPHVFSLFMQGARTQGRSRGGLGIGLTLVKRLVELHDGTVEARSEGTGRGSEFVVTLPVLEPAGRRAPAGLMPAMARQAPEYRRRVLVVDDNEDSVESLAALVGLMGHECVAARDGAEALRIAATFRPDTVLLDLGMPRMSGFDVCRAIRKEPWGAAATIAAVTGWGQAEDRIRTRQAGFDQHFVKPVDPSTLAEFLARPVVRVAAPV